MAPTLTTAMYGAFSAAPTQAGTTTLSGGAPTSVFYTNSSGASNVGLTVGLVVVAVLLLVCLLVGVVFFLRSRRQQKAALDDASMGDLSTQLPDVPVDGDRGTAGEQRQYDVVPSTDAIDMLQVSSSPVGRYSNPNDFGGATMYAGTTSKLEF